MTNNARRLEPGQAIGDHGVTYVRDGERKQVSWMKHDVRTYILKCHCGEEFQREQLGKFWRGQAQSCGCTSRKRAAEKMITHGNCVGARKKRKEGDSAWTPEYQAWVGAKQRSTSTTSNRAHDYIERGIGMDQEFQDSFEAFLEEVGIKPEGDYSLDRIKNDKGYVKGNMRWATRSQQQQNRRNTCRVEYRGELRILREFQQEFQIAGNYRSLSDLVKSNPGVTGEDLLKIFGKKN